MKICLKNSLLFFTVFFGREIHAVRSPASIELIGPNAEVIIFYMDEKKNITAIKCDNWIDVSILEERTACIENPNRKDSWILAVFLRKAGVSQFTEEEAKAKIQDLQNLEERFKLDIARMENFVEKFGEKAAGDLSLLENKKEKLIKIQEDLNALQERSHPALVIFDQINSLIDLISRDTYNYLIYGNEEDSIAFNKLKNMLHFSHLNTSNPMLYADSIDRIHY